MTKCFEQALPDHAKPGYTWALGGEDLGFSWSSCDGCGSKLGGDRFRINLLPIDSPINDDTIIPIAVCIDCLMVYANGDMPSEFCGECIECSGPLNQHSQF